MNRSACRISPAATSSYRTRPGRIGSPAASAEVHPLGRAPLLEEDGIIYVESAAIIEHLVASTGQLGAPAGSGGGHRYHMFLHYAEGSLMPPLLALLVVGRLGLFGRPARKPLLTMFADHLAWLNGELSGRDWFAGERSAPRT